MGKLSSSKVHGPPMSFLLSNKHPSNIRHHPASADCDCPGMLACPLCWTRQRVTHIFSRLQPSANLQMPSRKRPRTQGLSPHPSPGSNFKLVAKLIRNSTPSVHPRPQDLADICVSVSSQAWVIVGYIWTPNSEWVIALVNQLGYPCPAAFQPMSLCTQINKQPFHGASAPLDAWQHFRIHPPPPPKVLSKETTAPGMLEDRVPRKACAQWTPGYLRLGAVSWVSPRKWVPQGSSTNVQQWEGRMGPACIILKQQRAHLPPWPSLCFPAPQPFNSFIKVAHHSQATAQRMISNAF